MEHWDTVVVGGGPAGMMAAAVAAGPQEQVTARFRAEEDSLHRLYRELHQAPELSWREVETGKRFAAELRATGHVAAVIGEVVARNWFNGGWVCVGACAWTHCDRK